MSFCVISSLSVMGESGVPRGFKKSNGNTRDNEQKLIISRSVYDRFMSLDQILREFLS